MELRSKCVNSSPVDSAAEFSVQTELAMLREKNNELTRQKQQLSEHITMVAAENRQLWSRLSKLTKNNENFDQQQDKLDPGSPSNTHQNLIRSKTFTQNNPNPKLREKFNKDEDPADLLVDVSKFAISEGNNQNGNEIQEYKKITEDMTSMKEEADRQQVALKTVFDRLKQRKPIKVCSNCASKTKSATTKTDEQDKGNSQSSGSQQIPEEKTTNKNNFVDIVLNTTDNINFIDTKRKADALNNCDRICPMCGRIYSKESVFEEFMEHVETHFIASDDEDVSIDPAYEMVYNPVGNF